MADSWLHAAQFAASVAAVCALVIAVRSVRAVRRSPLAAAYLHAWDEFVSVVVEASNSGPEPFAESRAHELLLKARAASHRLDVLDAALGVKAFDGAARTHADIILVSTLFESDPDRQDVRAGDLPADLRPASVDRATWNMLGSSVAVAVLLRNDVLFSPPANPWNLNNELLYWYIPNVVRDLTSTDSVYSPSASPQHQLARLLGDYHDTYLQPWIKNAVREALTGKRGGAGLRILTRRRFQNSEVRFRLARRRALKRYVKAGTISQP